MSNVLGRILRSALTSSILKNVTVLCLVLSAVSPISARRAGGRSVFESLSNDRGGRSVFESLSNDRSRSRDYSNSFSNSRSMSSDD